ncbi:MAG: TadE family protein [Desulfotignum sp.]|nr:TadE family protein [Desulfotignum sp.]
MAVIMKKGAAIVEFAIVLPLLLLLIGGIVQFGFIFNGQITLTSAVREGQDMLLSEMISAARKTKSRRLLLSGLLLQVSKDDVTVTPMGEAINVLSTGKVEIFMPFFGFLTDSGKSYKTLYAESTMRNEKTF